MVGAILFFFLFEGVGALFAWFGYSNLMENNARRKAWLSMEGSVTGFEETLGSKGRTLYAPVYRYVVEGQELTGVSSVSSSPPAYRIGSRIRLLVNPVKRDESMVLDNAALVFSWGFLLMGLVTAGVGLLAGLLLLFGNAH